MKDLKITIISILVMYIAFAFILMQFNAYYWEENARFALIVCSAGAYALVKLINYNGKP